MSELVVSLDVGGTLATASGPTLTNALLKLTPVPASEARDLMRRVLHNQPALSAAVRAAVCLALRIPERDFPTPPPAAPLNLLTGVTLALAAMAREARLVTLSNVTCTDADLPALAELLGDAVTAHFPSCRIGHTKPDPRAFTTVAEACGTTVAHLVHIGDDWHCDVLGARAAGATAVWISNGRRPPRSHPLVDQDVWTVRDLSEAVNVITTIAQQRRIS
ncbi:hypothetical protein GCM10010123_20390 [Pilimelia anulata]|uniref:Uncharacterized protein n=1 Tax=Pilimelia anulata TaxID=53371 RepID=A0A8J3B9B0_9ACTN|nr:HAD family hydrolase [Pilimelia anulata]GGJ90490.1 hypothetical protein GCM10010123_20390 [Pilimelia anulata]